MTSPRSGYSLGPSPATGYPPGRSAGRLTCRTGQSLAIGGVTSPVDLPAPGVGGHQELTARGRVPRPRGDDVERAHTVHGQAQRAAEHPRGDQPGPQAGVGTWTDPDRDRRQVSRASRRRWRVPPRSPGRATHRDAWRRPDVWCATTPRPSCSATVTAGVAVSKARISTVYQPSHPAPPSSRPGADRSGVR